MGISNRGNSAERKSWKSGGVPNSLKLLAFSKLHDDFPLWSRKIEALELTATRGPDEQTFKLICDALFGGKLALSSLQKMSCTHIGKKAERQTRGATQKREKARH